MAYNRRAWRESDTRQFASGERMRANEAFFFLHLRKLELEILKEWLHPVALVG